MSRPLWRTIIIQLLIAITDVENHTACVQGITNGTNGIPISLTGKTIGINGNSNGTTGYEWYHW